MLLAGLLQTVLPAPSLRTDTLARLRQAQSAIRAATHSVSVSVVLAVVLPPTHTAQFERASLSQRHVTAARTPIRAALGACGHRLIQESVDVPHRPARGAGVETQHGPDGAFSTNTVWAGRIRSPHQSSISRDPARSTQISRPPVNQVLGQIRQAGAGTRQIKVSMSNVDSGEAFRTSSRAARKAGRRRRPGPA
jgi:hypothetical protein